eukprot:scaffold292830_cov25-Tisochrysis_lutea.AAC.1
MLIGCRSVEHFHLPVCALDTALVWKTLDCCDRCTGAAAQPHTSRFCLACTFPVYLSLPIQIAHTYTLIHKYIHTQAVEERFVSLGNALLALATATSPTACSSLRVVAINYIMSLTSTPAHVEAMGGLVQDYFLVHCLLMIDMIMDGHG